MTSVNFLMSEVLDPEAAERFLRQLAEKHPSAEASLQKHDALLSDVLTLVSCSPLFATSLLREPEHIYWLGRERSDMRVRDKQTLLESLARFALTHSQIEPHVLLARFRRREIMRIFLRDVRRLATISEITEEISNLADAILEHALRLAEQELDNRFGRPQEKDDQGRLRAAQFCIISLGKLGSRELNYSSDIDLLFIFSNQGRTSGTGKAGAVTNLEYFSKLTEAIIKLVGGQGGEGAAYRVDMRLRPQGRVGPLALPLMDSIRYYRTESAAWERQVLIRSRASAGSEDVFRQFIHAVEDSIFSVDETVETSLRNVSLSKQKMDLRSNGKSTDIKLGRGGIREIEFIAQALQLAHGGRDRWLRTPHTLKSLDRLADRGYLKSKELTKLFDAYDFLRRLEHILQIEDGLQTHIVPEDKVKRFLIERRLSMNSGALDAEVLKHTDNVNRVFCRVFSERSDEVIASERLATTEQNLPQKDLVLHEIAEFAPRFLEVAKANPTALDGLSEVSEPFPDRNYSAILGTDVASAGDFGNHLRTLRQGWYKQLIEIVVFDAFGKLQLAECKTLQTRLAEASIEAALQIAASEIGKRFEVSIDGLPLAVLGLGKLGGGGMDYDSDLDMVFVYDERAIHGSSHLSPELVSRLIENFTTVLSSITRDGHLYRVDLRLRPHGSDGPLVMSRKAFADYFKNDADIWELLAFLKLRAVGGKIGFAQRVENEIRDIIHERALKIDRVSLAAETRAVRDKLEKRKVGRGSKDIDIKFESGGLLDIYFAIRYIQLRFNIPDEGDDRSTSTVIDRIAAHFEAFNYAKEALDVCRDGYAFLSSLDHSVRLNLGRTTRLGLANVKALSKIARRMDLSSPEELLSQLTQHRIAIRDAFDRVLSKP
jgi:[glutamine synthetase] adenylyltransferase / [glutamine synthetase]-adenylyl-L-tyrosine phosphorylase